jgi:hypothetical protein
MATGTATIRSLGRLKCRDGANEHNGDQKLPHVHTSEVGPDDNSATAEKSG